MAPAGFCFYGGEMALEPTKKRAISFIDGQNLYHCAKEAFGYGHPNYDPLKLSQKVSNNNGWMLKQARFYTGYPPINIDPLWGAYWQKRLLAISRQGVKHFARELRVRTRQVTLNNGEIHDVKVCEEKGIDVRIAIDVIRLALDNEYDVAIIFSQDQDLSEVASEIKKISRTQDRWIKIASAFPIGNGTVNRRGINGTDWLPIDKVTYDCCIDERDYRPK